MRGKRGWTEGKMIPGRGKTIYNGQGETWPVGGVITANLEHRLRWVRAGWCRVRLEQLAGLLCPCRGVPPHWPRRGAFTHRISFLSLGSRSSSWPSGSHVPLRGGNQRRTLGWVLRPTSPTPAAHGPPCPGFLEAAAFVIANCTMRPSLPPPEREEASE